MSYMKELLVHSKWKSNMYMYIYIYNYCSINEYNDECITYISLHYIYSLTEDYHLFKLLQSSISSYIPIQSCSRMGGDQLCRVCELQLFNDNPVLLKQVFLVIARRKSCFKCISNCTSKFIFYI